MGKLEQELRKLSKKELQQLDAVLEKLQQGKFDTLHVKKLKGAEDLYRVRIGTIRITYSITKSGEMRLHAVRKRSEKTYRDL